MSTININMAGSNPSIGGSGSTRSSGFAEALSSLTDGASGAQGGDQKDKIIAMLAKALEQMAGGGQDNAQNMSNYAPPCCEACG